MTELGPNPRQGTETQDRQELGVSAATALEGHAGREILAQVCLHLLESEH